MGAVTDDSAENSRRMTGMEFVRAIFEGTVRNPYIHHNGITLERIEHGLVQLRMVAQEQHINSRGTVQGGILAMLADSAAGNAIHSTLPAGKTYTGINLNCEFTKAVLEGETLTAVGEVIQGKGKTPLARAEIRNDDGHIVAHGQARFFVIDVTDGARPG